MFQKFVKLHYHFKLFYVTTCIVNIICYYPENLLNSVFNGFCILTMRGFYDFAIWAPFYILTLSLGEFLGVLHFGPQSLYKWQKI